jgi:hypothetical protein
MLILLKKGRIAFHGGSHHQGMIALVVVLDMLLKQFHGGGFRR